MFFAQQRLELAGLAGTATQDLRVAIGVVERGLGRRGDGRRGQRKDGPEGEAEKLGLHENPLKLEQGGWIGPEVGSEAVGRN
jgi:hypothetical protein